MRIAVTAEAATLRVAFRKNVQAPATDEFRSGDFHLFRFVTAANRRAGASAECHPSVFVTNKTMIRDRAARHVTGQVFQNLIRCGLRRTDTDTDTD